MSVPNNEYIYLHKVDGDANNNKFYEMTNLGNGQFQSKYGREGAAKPAIQLYPMSKWDSVYREKTSSKKGYTDVTKFKSAIKVDQPSSAKNSKGQLVSNDPEVVSLITKLQSYAQIATAASYKVEAKSVTQAQIDEAQKQIDNLSNSIKYFGEKSWDFQKFNKALTYLMIVIPRKMKNVADCLITSSTTKKEIEKLINDEQSLLDSMAGQVITNTATDANDKEDISTVSDKTLLDALGLEIRLATPAEIKEVKSNCQQHGHRVKRVFRVINKATQKTFDEDLKKASNKKTMTLWHGSRRQNWFFIINQGLKIRPSGAIHTGSMFGDSIYHAIDDDKSMGYTDGGRWASGSVSGHTYMALNEVRIGNAKIIHKHDSSCFSLNYKQLKNEGFDSVWAKKGPSLNRDEIMVYNASQVTIKYLIEFM